MRVLGIDPGFGRCGVALLEGNNATSTLIYSSCIETSQKESFSFRLFTVGKTIDDLITTHEPDIIAIEELYFTNNAKTAFHVAEVRGMIMYIAATHRITLVEYNPLAIKIALTGYGRATKDQVMKMVDAITHAPKVARLDDEYDAIAVALTALANERTIMGTRVKK